jgi:hypothetical protein
VRLNFRLDHLVSFIFKYVLLLKKDIGMKKLMTFTSPKTLNFTFGNS